MASLAQVPMLRARALDAESRPRWVEVVSHLDPRYGGLSAAVPELAGSLAEGLGGTAMDVSLAAFCAAGEEYAPAGFGPDRMRFWPASRGSWLKDRMRGGTLRQGLQEQIRNADGVHLHGLWEGSTAEAAGAARRLGKPYVISAHGMLEPWALAKKRVKKLVYAALVERENVAGATCLHALTEAEAEQFVAFGARSPIAIIPNAVECPTDVDERMFLREYPALRGTRVVLFMARLHAKKGLDLLLEAWGSIAVRHPDARLVLAGPDSDGTEARLRAEVARAGLGESVVFAGMLRGEMKWSALAAAEGFVLPSYSEGLSVAVLEAMGMGLPVVVTRQCNLPEVGTHGAGWVTEPDADEVCGALKNLLDRTPAENCAMGARGARLVKERYAWPVVARQMSEVYAWALGGPMPEHVDLVFPAGGAR